MTDDEPDLFDLPAGKAARDAAMDQIDENANEEWRLFMLEVIRETARRYEFFTTDRIYATASERNTPYVHDRRALGPLMTQMQKAFVIEPTERFDSSQRPVAHASPKRVWRSLIYGR